MSGTLPLAIVFSSHGGEDDNQSELTPGQFDIDSNENGNSRGTSRWGGTHLSQMYTPPSSGWGGRSFVDDYVPVKEELQQQELVGLKLQLAFYKERLNVLSSKMSRAHVENESLKCDKKNLLDELSLAKNKRLASPATRRFSFQGFGAGASESNNVGGSMQLLLDRNARLMDENSCLHASVDSIKKSFQNHIKCSLRSGREDEEAMQILRRENEVLKQQLNLENEILKQQLNLSSELNPAKPSKRHSLSKDTAKTTWASDDTSEENQEYANMLTDYRLPLKKLDEMLVNFFHSPDNQEGKLRVSGHIQSARARDEDCGARDRAAVDDTDIERRSKFPKKAPPCRRTDELLVDFGIRRPSQTPRGASHRR